MSTTWNLAYAAADLMLCRAGAMTCAELTAVGLPGVYVPLPHGNGEQRFNAAPIVDFGGGLMVSDAELRPAWIRDLVIPLLTNQRRLRTMSARAADLGRRDADEKLVDMIVEAAASRPGRTRRVRQARGGRTQGSRLMSAAAQSRRCPADHLGVVHFIGIGGGGMSGIARIMLTRGATVTGSDAKEARVLAALRVLGAKVFVGHDAANLGAADTVVVSSAIQESNPELVEARARGLRILPRAAALASVMAGRRGIAVAGTHGKTTTTSMLARALQHCGEDPSFAIGADLNEPGSNAHDGGRRHYSSPRPTRATSRSCCCRRSRRS